LPACEVSVVHDEHVDALAAVLAQTHDLSNRRDRVAIGVDGPDAAGKSTFADRLAALMGPAVLRASLDDFQRPREERYRRGRFSPQGYYLDAFDHAAARRVLLDPFLAGAATVRTATFDHRADTAIEEAAADVPSRAVLIVDGMFLLRPELRSAWALSVYLHVSGDESLRRGKREGRRVGQWGSDRAAVPRAVPAGAIALHRGGRPARSRQHRRRQRGHDTSPNRQLESACAALTEPRHPIRSSR
jgi:uridine kinase